MVKRRCDYASKKEYYIDSGYKYTENGTVRESIVSLIKTRMSRYLEFLFYVCKLDVTFYLPFLWKYVQATLQAPLNEFSPLIIRVLLEK